MNLPSEVRKRGWMVDWVRMGFVWSEITIQNGVIAAIESKPDTFTSDERMLKGSLILPGLVDAHVHIESSMMPPSRFAEIAVRHGTVATVSDPHEIANVLGDEGIEFMMKDGLTVPLKFHFTYPSCVPATTFETSGAVLGSVHVERGLGEGSFVALGEMMNFPGVVFGDHEVMAKLEAAISRGLPVDGHAPALTGGDLITYVKAGISTDHECASLLEAEEKLSLGMKILIREGSAARNFDALAPLLDKYPERVMLCCDDIHPDDLCEGHIDAIIRKGMSKGISLINLLRAATINPHEHYRLKTGVMRIGDPADFIVVDRVDPFSVDETWIDGTCVARNGETLFKVSPVPELNIFRAVETSPELFGISASTGLFRVIRAYDGEILTGHETEWLTETDGVIQADPEKDLLKISVVNRYKPSYPVTGFIKGFGLKNGAIASSVAHDSHNIIVVGTSDVDMAGAVNMLVASHGGISVFSDGEGSVLPMPLAGLMSPAPGEETAHRYRELSIRVKLLGSTLSAPFMTLSFMALLVIPSLKIGDQGLFDGSLFKFVGIRADEA